MRNGVKPRCSVCFASPGLHGNIARSVARARTARRVFHARDLEIARQNISHMPSPSRQERTYSAFKFARLSALCLQFAIALRSLHRGQSHSARQSCSEFANKGVRSRSQLLRARGSWNVRVFPRDFPVPILRAMAISSGELSLAFAVLSLVAKRKKIRDVVLLPRRLLLPRIRIVKYSHCQSDL